MKPLLIALSLIALLASCSQAQKNIDAKTFRDLIAKTPNAIVLDVRTDAEVAQGVLPKAIQIDYNSPSFETQINKLDKSKPVFIYCAVGGRSGGASQILARKGFKNVYNLAGGISEWRSLGYAITTLKK